MGNDTHLGGKSRCCWLQRQPDAYLSQANPVSTTWYTVLATTTMVHLYGLVAIVTWAVTQPTPLEARILVDGNTIIHGQQDPVSATPYLAIRLDYVNEVNQGFFAMGGALTESIDHIGMDGHSLSVDVRVTWAITQPTPLVCRVKWARWV